MTSFSILSLKASRGLHLLASELPEPLAREEAERLYDASKKLADAGLVPTGVAILVVEDNKAPALLAQGCLYPQDSAHVLLQCGGF